VVLQRLGQPQGLEGSGEDIVVGSDLRADGGRGGGWSPELSTGTGGAEPSSLGSLLHRRRSPSGRGQAVAQGLPVGGCVGT